MPNLSRAEDHFVRHASWDQVSPAITEAPDGDRRTPPAFERIFASLAIPWDVQHEALASAAAELEQVRRQRDRLNSVRTQLMQARKTEQLAKSDLDLLQRRRDEAIARAGAGVDEQPRMTRKRRVEEARSQAARWFDERMAKTKRLTVSRLHTAKQEHRRLRDEEQELLRHHLVADPIAMHFIDEMHAEMTATAERDREARGQALHGWTQLRGTNSLIVDELRRLPSDDLLPGQAFGQGPIHLVIGQHLALVEVRRGRDGVDVRVERGVVHLEQVRPDGNVPLGFTSGSTAELHEAAEVVEGAIGVRPELVICISQYSREPEELADLHLCGPLALPDVIGGFEDVGLGLDELRSSARALAGRPLPQVEADPVASLDHFTHVDPEDVPEGLPATRDVIVLAHERRSYEFG